MYAGTSSWGDATFKGDTLHVSESAVYFAVNVNGGGGDTINVEASFDGDGDVFLDAADIVFSDDSFAIPGGPYSHMLIEADGDILTGSYSGEPLGSFTDPDVAWSLSIVNVVDEELQLSWGIV